METVVLSQQHEPDVSQAEMKERIESAIVKPVLAEFAQFSSDEITYHFNPTGRFVKGGPAGDTGLTGRKIIVDTYGGMCLMVAERSAARTPPRWTGARPTWLATWPSASWLPDWRGGWSSAWRMRSARPSRYLWT